MANDNSIQYGGNVTADPTMGTTSKGKTYVRFGIAWNQYRGEGNPTVPHFIDVTVFDVLAENVHASIRKGMRVNVEGRLDDNRWEEVNKDTGEITSRRKHGIIADEVSPSLRWATATVTKNPKSNVDTSPVPDADMPI
jgi:single-strand DNA-binding protein